jgi:iron complex transport system substrate-binding protein
MERIIQLNPDAILLSPYENSGNYGKLGQMGIPLVECADYMEGSPLGRTEWMKFYGILFGTEAHANGMFDNIEKEYKRLTALTDTVSYRPKVMIDRLYGNSMCLQPIQQWEDS